jgi:hypothetical protein
LPTAYYQIIFTIPGELHRLFRRAPELCLSLFFQAVSETLLEVGRNHLEGDIGFTAVLHTWTQKLRFHPHIHCLVPAGVFRALRNYDGQTVVFRYKDRKDGNKTKPDSVSGEKFSRLFLQHVLPDRFVRIRHYGILASRRRKDLERCRRQLGGRKPSQPKKESWAVAFRRLFGTDPLLCPRCQVGRLVVLDVLPPPRL